MAKTGDSSDGNNKPKPRSRAARPSFAQTSAPAAGSAWVYRSDAAETPAAKPSAVAAKAVIPPAKAMVVAPVTTAVVVKPTVKAMAKPAAPARTTPKAPIAATPVPAAGSSRVVHALDVVTLPIAMSLMAVLAPMRRLFGPSRH